MHQFYDLSAGIMGSIKKDNIGLVSGFICLNSKRPRQPIKSTFPMIAVFKVKMCVINKLIIPSSRIASWDDKRIKHLDYILSNLLFVLSVC